MMTFALALGLKIALIQPVSPQDRPGPREQETYKGPGKNKLVYEASPNFSVRPPDTVVDTIILHHTASNSLGSVVKWFGMTESQVSAHYTVGRDGSIVQHVSTFDRAWHAGNSIDKFGRTNVNNFSVGIEIVNRGDGTDPWPQDQIDAVHNLCAYLKRHRYPAIKQIASHEFIAVPPGRKNDPHDFPWAQFKDLGVDLSYGRADKQN